MKILGNGTTPIKAILLGLFILIILVLHDFVLFLSPSLFSVIVGKTSVPLILLRIS